MLSGQTKREIEQLITKTVIVMMAKMEPDIISKVKHDLEKDLHKQLDIMIEAKAEAMCKKCPFQ